MGCGASQERITGARCEEEGLNKGSEGRSQRRREIDTRLGEILVLLKGSQVMVAPIAKEKQFSWSQCNWQHSGRQWGGFTAGCIATALSQ